MGARAAGHAGRSKVTFDYSRYLGELARRPAHHPGRRGLLHRAGLRPGLRPGEGQDRDRPGSHRAPVLETFKGYRLTDDDRLEVYVDFWHFDEDPIAAYASPVSFDMPWEVKAAMDDLVFGQRRAAYSDTAAARYGVPWLSLVLERDAGLVDRTLREFERDEVVPEGVFQFGDRTLVTPEEARARYQAAQDWFDEKDHLVISNGPFYLERFDPPAQFAELDAFRDPSYPFHPGDLYRGQPPTITIDGVDDATGRPGEDAIVTGPSSGPGTLGVRYLLLDPTSGRW